MIPKKLVIVLSMILGFIFISNMPSLADDSVAELASLINTTAQKEKGLCLVIDPADGQLPAHIAKINKMYVQGCVWGC